MTAPRLARYDDRRTEHRVRCDCPVTIVVDGSKRRGRIVDLSCGGARIGYENSRMKPPRGPHRLCIEAGDLEPVEVVAMPTWHARFSYGVRFLLTDEMERLAVAELIDQATQQSQRHADAPRHAGAA